MALPGLENVKLAQLDRLPNRLDRQLERPVIYYETPTYFGPDRRNRLGDDEGHSARGTGGQFRRLEIVRTPATGASVVNEDMQFMV